MHGMDIAPQDGRYLTVWLGGTVFAFAYFANGNWIAPLMKGKPELGEAIVFPKGWANL
jgi:hypothetical protein